MAKRLICVLGGLSFSIAAIFPVFNRTKYQRSYNETENKKIKINEAIKQSRKLINRLKNEVGAPGIVVGVSVDGEEFWKEGFGFADIENEVEAHDETVMRIASISKSLTAAVVARLWQDGIIDIDKPVQSYVPTFPEKKIGEEKVAITTRQLMCHLSGIRHYSKKKNEESVGSGDGQLEEFYSKERYDSVEKALAIFKDDELLHAPGSKFLYTTYGWTLVSAVMEGATGKTYPQIMRAFLRELGMRRTYLDQPEPIIYGRSKCYGRNKNGRVVNSPYVDNSCKWAGGGFLSTVGDLLKFSNALLFAFQRDGDIEVAKGSYKMVSQKSMNSRNASDMKSKKNSAAVEETTEKAEVTKGEILLPEEKEKSPASLSFSGVKDLASGVKEVGSEYHDAPEEKQAPEENLSALQKTISVIGSGVGSITSGVISGASSVWNYGSSRFRSDESASVEKDNKENESQDSNQIGTIVTSRFSSAAKGVVAGSKYVWGFASSFIGSKQENDKEKAKSTTSKDAEETKSVLSSLGNLFRPKALYNEELPANTSGKNQEESSFSAKLLIGKFFWNDIVIPYAVCAITGQLFEKVNGQSEEEDFEILDETDSPFFSKRLGRKPYILPSTVAKLWTRVDGTHLSDWGPHVEGGYGLGFGVASPVDSAGGVIDGGQPYIIGHTGGAVGASSAMIIFPRKCNNEEPPKGIAVVLLCNMQSVSLNPLAIEIAKIFSNV